MHFPPFSFSLNTKSSYVIVACSAILMVLVVLTWFRKLWIMHTTAMEDDENKNYEPNNRVWRSLYQISFQLSNGAIVRTSLYLVVIVLLVITSLLHMVGGNHHFIRGIVE